MYSKKPVDLEKQQNVAKQKAQKAEDARSAMAQHEIEMIKQKEKTARLRALRLAAPPPVEVEKVKRKKA